MLKLIFLSMSRKNILFPFVIMLFGIFYVSQAWSPSSYGIILESLYSKNSDLVLGSPRAIRSDEWVVLTPMVQATVNNNFKRYNNTSIYYDDMRINYGLPIFDWGLIFKPSFFGFVVLDPKFAYSLHFYFLGSLFIIGYALLFRRLNIKYPYNYIWSISLFFTGFIQFWWSTNAATFSYFPIMMLIVLSKKKYMIKTISLAYILICWTFENLYPPFQISLLLCMFLIHFSFLKFNLSSFLMYAIAFLISGSVIFYYFFDYISVMSHTSYPGNRYSVGGGISEKEIFSYMYPTLMFDSNYNTTFKNVCETSSMGLFFYFSSLFFINLKKINSFFKIRAVKIMISIALIMFFWMILPLPSYIGQIFLWHKVPPERMGYAFGVVLAMLGVMLYKTHIFKYSKKRYFLFCISFLLVWWKYKVNEYGIDKSYIEILVLFLFTVVFMIKNIDIKNKLLISSMLSSIVIFAPFNPIQSLDKVFNSDIKNKVDTNTINNNLLNEVIINSIYPGSIMNGLGFMSLAHVSAMPKLDVWKKIFPESKTEIFNRYAHIWLSDDAALPYNPQADVIVLPRKYFLNNPDLLKIIFDESRKNVK